MKNLTYYIIAILCCMGACISACRSDEENPADIAPAESPQQQLIHRVTSTDRLYTTEYVVKKMVTYDDIIKLKGTAFSRKFDFTLPQGDRKIIIPMEARIKAYIDFSGFGPDNVEILPDSTIHIYLPDPKIELTSTKIDHRGIKSFVDFGRSRFTQAEMSEYEKQGRAAIVSSIPRMGITETARTHAYHFLLPMVEAMGYPAEKIVVDYGRRYTDADYANHLITFPKD